MRQLRLLQVIPSCSLPLLRRIRPALDDYAVGAFTPKARVELRVELLAAADDRNVVSHLLFQDFGAN